MPVRVPLKSNELAAARQVIGGEVGVVLLGVRVIEAGIGDAEAERLVIGKRLAWMPDLELVGADQQANRGLALVVERAVLVRR